MSDPTTTSPKPSKPTWRQALVMLGGGSLLASSACYGAISREKEDAIALTFFAIFGAGMVLALVGVILVVVRSAKQPVVSDAALPEPRPTWSQALVMLASGVVVGVSSCFGFFETLGKKGPTQNLYGPFATGFYVGCLVALGGLIMALIRVARSLSRKLPSRG